MGRSTVHYADNTTNNTLKKLHNKLRPAGTPVQRVEYIIELLLLRIFEAKLKHDQEFQQLRPLFRGENENLLFSSLFAVPNEKILPTLNNNIFPFYSRILSEARKVLKGNPSIKVQDQLVLIEEVFGNSNFTNNVTSGNLQEVISLVGELDEERLLKTDLLGDAIESSLSETGGTKDIGLYRTPDHIRHFMVGIVEPDFSDLVLDPACGTGGFLFDGFEYVMESVSKEGKWPGPKAHPEMAAWFKEHFAKKKTPMPSIEATTDFYRNGVMGIEYLGMIRKMASINFYIRGLNPANIIQGDSLARFKKDFFPESKTAVLANPPFGADRDQEAYPDVWSEYPKESETTILFVKLMLESLKKGGRCAVIVSEGFMTWDQNSARALRKSLLEDANLRAVISLPQGVFVSKGGQGPKTSILYFEKGAPTRHVWFYKVANDGYTSGTNRKQIVGCQFTEALDLFHRYVQKDEIAPDTRHSFTVPVNWVKTLDPRVKERIRTETTEELSEKEAEEQAKLADTLNTRFEGGKITQEEFNDRLKQHDLLWKGKLSNEIARRIERAHLYSFNLPNYRSNLSQPQIDAWTAFAAERETVTDETLDRQYARLKSANTEELDRLLSAFDPRNALELDIARQFLAGLASEIIESNPHLKTLLDIITTAANYPRGTMEDILSLRREVLPQAEYKGDIDILAKIRFSDGKIFLREDRQTGTNLQFTGKGDLLISKINFHQGATAVNNIGRILTSMDYLVYQVDREQAAPEFIMHLVRTPRFLQLLTENKPGGVKGRSQPEFIETLTIPFPPIEVQEAIVAEIDRQQAIVAGAELILDYWKIEKGMFTGDEIALSDIADIGTGSTPSRENNAYFDGDINWVLTAEVDECEISSTTETLTDKAIKDYGLKIYQENTILVAMYGQGKTRGKSALLKCKSAITQNCAGIVIRRDDVLPKYIYYYLRSIYEIIRGQEYSGAGVPHLNLKIIGSIRIPIPSKDTQGFIVSMIDGQIATLEGLRAIKTDAEARIKQIVDNVWENR